MSKNNSSGFLEVCWNLQRQKWMARIMVVNKIIYLGLFEEFDEAVEACKKAKIKYHTSSPEAANLLRKESLERIC